ncbi:MAG: acetyl/propionyl/methylcrotonyl-CoA carboxylase subunit alpha [Pseudomarimonas sp.]
MIKRLLIANRGEIACRIIRTCRRLGVATVAVYSDADAGARHVRMADQAVHIGGSPPTESYLRMEAVLDAARRSGADAIHPGFGFLSENADFAEAVEAAGLIFVGPRASSMRKLGSKAGAKQLMLAHGVPVVPGYSGEDQSAGRLANEANAIGYPLMIKAAHGGGGKGMRVVRAASEFVEALASCQREAASAFGRDRVLLERYLETPRHIEFQIFGDRHGNLLHLNERECSAQRRYQKVLEEAPSPTLTPALRVAMGEAAVKAGRAVDYVNAGTVELILAADGQFYFMEINARLQVEHPVTEATTGLDLVEWQLRIAAGEPLPLNQPQIVTRGHAIELRLYAEDAERGFLPGSGRLERLELPHAMPGIRIDAGVDAGDVVSVFYDPMIAKLIAFGDDREQALVRLRDALAAIDVVGPACNIGFLERLIAHPSVQEARIDTGYLDRHLDEFVSLPDAPPVTALAAAATLRLLAERVDAAAEARSGADPHSPWAMADGWRIGQTSAQPLVLQWRDQRIELQVEGTADEFRLLQGSQTLTVKRLAQDATHLTLLVDGRSLRLPARLTGEDILVHIDAQRYRFHPARPFGFAGAAATSSDRLRAPMPGRIVAVHAAVGDRVEAQQAVLVMEAMKMELTLRAPMVATVLELPAVVGEFVEADAVLARFSVE